MTRLDTTVECPGERPNEGRRAPGDGVAQEAPGAHVGEGTTLLVEVSHCAPTRDDSADGCRSTPTTLFTVGTSPLGALSAEDGRRGRRT